MNIETTNTATTQLLNEYYQISTQAIPTQRVKSEWQDDNKRAVTPVSSNPTSRTNSADDLDYVAKFGKLKQYVDVVDDKLVIKVINETNDLTSDKHKKWIETIEDLKVIRRTRQKRWTDNRQTVESNSEMTLYFIHNNLTRLPNRNALELHKTTCLIWCIAGGAEFDDEYCPYDDDGCTPVDYQNSSDDDIATNDRGTDSAVFLHCGITIRIEIGHIKVICHHIPWPDTSIQNRK
ncbi:hypothetical protein BATDEDRAFT_25353 [Batrachochytrium dendrobatidis JAM81]|uniref:Uncharacterized protein n=1 Tax=Batrachochytrium dendrobatidis (strain JAM81 / FGSC 10211) TaxID=684364 RepID=F4P4S8_BATDJ|nr:uncharacterized protein BATDEDRAFT_25353 [Batrachochytrium dendrobatidis JAM81]EGF79661.1 hypothetical protein BATDEDRAFT_25353 [Batrachochytrium dendrobatidis JAM81]|eukprot:XP_006679431.1 hypothetical protein BATDEDRAFT_25353 [Batrachochytrium dendrobatidis JAM81]